MYDIVATLVFITILLFAFLGQLQQGVFVKKQFINYNENIAAYDYQTKISTQTNLKLVRSNGVHKIPQLDEAIKPIKCWFENISNMTNMPNIKFQ